MSWQEEAGKDYVVLSVVAPTLMAKNPAADFKTSVPVFGLQGFPSLAR